MARKHVAKHLKKLDGHHQKFRKQIYKHLKKLARHKGCYVEPVKRRRKKGGAILKPLPAQKAGPVPKMTKARVRRRPEKTKSKAAKGQMLAGSGQLLSGSGFRKRKKKRKLPAWVSKPVPKGKKYPKVPKGFNKQAAGLWDKIKSGASSIGNTFAKHADTIKKIGSAVGKTALDLGTQYISGKIQQGQAMAQAKLDQAQQAAQQYANQAQNQVQNYVQQGQQYGQQMYQQGMAQGQQWVDRGGRMVNVGMQQAQQAVYDEFGRLVGYR